MDTTYELDSIRLEYLESWEENRAPSLESLVARHPQYAAELSDLVFSLLEEDPVAGARREAEPAEDPALARMLAFVHGNDESLAQARKAVGWSPGALAQRLNLPARMVAWLEQGTLRELPEQLELRLAELFARSRDQVREMLAPPVLRRPAGAFFRATGGSPRTPVARERTFEEALAECARQEPLTESQRQEWLGTA